MDSSTKFRRPSPAMIVAVIALFAALSGGAYAALSKNSVTSKQVKNGSLKGKDLKQDTITGKSVRESALNGVNAASLGKLKVINVGPIELADDATSVIATAGSLTLTATCQINNAGNDEALIQISTSADDAAVDGSDGDPDFDVADPPLEFAGDSSTTGVPAFDQESDGVGVTADGKTLIENGLWSATNVFGSIGTCQFGGQVLVSDS